MTYREVSREYDGWHIGDVAKSLGLPVSAARDWIRQRGMRCGDNVVSVPRLPTDREDEINARIAAAPPSTPCFRCGARSGCGHRHH